jgi:ribonuclease VapC
MIFVDASAMVAILTREPEADILADMLDAAAAPMTSAIATFEAALGLCRKHHVSVEEAAVDIQDFLAPARITLVTIAAAEADTALAAFSRYGKGRGHQAQLNLGDCFAYAVAKNRGAALLFKGDDFTRTDIGSAITPR